MLILRISCVEHSFSASIELNPKIPFTLHTKQKHDLSSLQIHVLFNDDDLTVGLYVLYRRHGVTMLKNIIFTAVRKSSLLYNVGYKDDNGQ
jgi:hypothetical protein